MTTNTVKAHFVAENVDEELSIDQLSDLNGAAVWGVLAPVAASFAAGYAVGTGSWQSNRTDRLSFIHDENSLAPSAMAGFYCPPIGE